MTIIVTLLRIMTVTKPLTITTTKLVTSTIMTKTTMPTINYLDIGSVDADQLRLVRPLLGARLKVGEEPDSEVHLQD